MHSVCTVPYYKTNVQRSPFLFFKLSFWLESFLWKSGYPVYQTTTNSPAGPIVGECHSRHLGLDWSSLLENMNCFTCMLLWSLSLYSSHHLSPGLLWLTKLSTWVLWDLIPRDSNTQTQILMFKMFHFISLHVDSALCWLRVLYRQLFYRAVVNFFHLNLYEHSAQVINMSYGTTVSLSWVQLFNFYSDLLAQNWPENRNVSLYAICFSISRHR